MYGRVVISYWQYKYNDDLSERLSVINNMTDLSEGLPVINDTINLNKELLVINNTTSLSKRLQDTNDTSAKLTFVVDFLINTLKNCVVNDLYGQ